MTIFIHHDLNVFHHLIHRPLDMLPQILNIFHLF